MKESTLVQLKAEAMSSAQIAAELMRLDRAIEKLGYLPGMVPSREAKRYQMRRAIFAAELNRRSCV